MLQSENLKRKLRILLSHSPQKRSEIFLEIRKSDKFILQKTENKDKPIIVGKNLEDS